MADTKISALSDASALAGTEQIPGVQSAANVKLTPAQIRAYMLGQANTWAGIQTVGVEDSGTNTVLYPVSIVRTSSGTPANGIGVGLPFTVETSAGNNEIGAIIVAVTTDVTATSEDFDLVFQLMTAGAAAATRATLKSTHGWSMPNSSDSATVITYGWSGLSGIGFSANSNNDGGGVFFSAGGSKVVRFAQNRLSLSANTPVLWNDTDGNAGTGTGDTAVNRISAGLVGFGKGTVVGSYVGTGFAGGWKATTAIMASDHGETDTSTMVSESITLNTGAATTVSAANLAPANSIIEWIGYRITTAFGTAASFDIRVTGGNPFASIGTATTSQGTVTVNTTGVLVPAAHADGYNASATTLTITPNTTPSAGVIRVTVKYRQIVPPSS